MGSFFFSFLSSPPPPPCSCYNCGGLDHHAKECGLPPQPKKCHYCQSITHMVAQCPHKAPAPATGSQDQHVSTSALSPGGGPLLGPPEEEGEEQRSGSSPLEGSSSSPEEPHTHRGPRTQRWRKSWIRAGGGETFHRYPFLPPTVVSPLNQGYLNPPSHFIYLTPAKNNNGTSRFLHLCFPDSAARAAIIGVDVTACDPPAVSWCVHGNRCWNGDRGDGLFFLLSISAAQEGNNEVQILFSPFFLFSFLGSTFILFHFFKACGSNHSEWHTR